MGAVRPFRKINTRDADLMRLQDAVAESFSSITSPLLDGRLVRNVAVSTSPTFVEHGLGREPLGFLIVDRIENVSVWRSPTNPAPAKLLALAADVPSTVTLYVF